MRFKARIVQDKVLVFAGALLVTLIGFARDAIFRGSFSCSRACLASLLLPGVCVCDWATCDYFIFSTELTCPYTSCINILLDRLETPIPSVLLL